MYSVLYVDDEPSLLEIGKLFLERGGQFSVETTDSATAALTLLAAKTYDAIVSDYQMPGRDGIDFLRTVRNSGNSIPFILFTGRGREEVAIQALNEGADFYLQKGGEPVSQFAELSHKIQIAVEHHRDSEKIQSLNRLYSVLSETNKAVFRIRTKSDFFSEICRILVGIGGFRMAWIGVADPDTGIIRPVASSGFVKGYLDTMTVSVDDVPHGRGPTGTAYREGKYFFSNDISGDPRTEPWREEALKRGYLAIAAYPFALGTKNAGILSLYAPVTGFFDQQIVGLLDELAVDITFALRTLDDQEAWKVSDTALRESERRYRNVVEDQTEFISRFLPDGTHVFVNEAYCRYFGLDRDRILGHRFRPRIPAEDQERVSQFFASLTPDHPVESIEQRTLMPDSSIRWLRWIDRAIFDPSGEVIEYQSVGRDITEQKQAEEALRKAEEKARESEEFLRTVITGAKEGIVVYDRELRITLWNRFMEEMTGIPAAEVLGKEATGLFPFLKEQGIDLLMTQALSGITAESSDFEFFIHSTGKRGWVKGIYSPNYDGHGTIVGVIGIVRNITARKQAEEALRERTVELDNRNRLIGILLDTVPIGIFMVEAPSGRPIIANHEATRLLGRGILPAATGTNLTGAYEAYRAGTAERYPAGEMPIVRGMKGETSHIDDIEVVRPDGTRVHLEISGNPIRDREGHVVASLVSFLDITERKHAEEALKAAYEQIADSEEELKAQVDELRKGEDALRRSAENYRSVIENIQDVYYRSDRDGKVIIASPSALSLFGYASLDEIIGKPIADTFYADPDERKRFLDLLTVTGSLHDYETRLRKKDGTPIIVSTSSHYYYDAQGKIAGVEGILRDITAQKQTEEALKDSTRRLSEIISFLPDATFAIDRGGTVIAWNHAMEEMTGVPVTQILGRGDYAYAVPFYGVKCPLLIDLVFTPAEEIAKKYSFVEVTGDVLTAETANATPRGKNVVLWGKAAPLYDREGKVTGAIESIRDITERKRAQEALVQVNRKLNLLSGITRHDITNQLTVLQSYLSVMEKMQQPDPPGDRYLREMASAARRISFMIRFTRDYESIGVNAPVWQDCRTLVDTAAAQAPLGSVTVKNDIPAGTEVFADPLTAKVIYNLMDNAVRHGGRTTTVRFSVAESGGDPALVCEDDGEGIPAGEKEQIFDQGFGKNTGLGLFLAREILEMSGITITETGEPGKGARFEMKVPKKAYRVITGTP
jgi:PAS domain S-box-containing protein